MQREIINALPPADCDP